MTLRSRIFAACVFTGALGLLMRALGLWQLGLVAAAVVLAGASVLLKDFVWPAVPDVSGRLGSRAGYNAGMDWREAREYLESIAIAAVVGYGLLLTPESWRPVEVALSLLVAGMFAWMAFGRRSA